jgi:hypothetical protein
MAKTFWCHCGSKSWQSGPKTVKEAADMQLQQESDHVKIDLQAKRQVSIVTVQISENESRVAASAAV